MGHIDEMLVTNLEATKVVAQRLDAQAIKRDALPSAITAGAHTITIAEIKNGILRMDPTAARDFTAPTAALAVAGVVGCQVGDSLDFHIINQGTAGEDETITVVTASGATLVGFMDVENPVTTHDAFSVGSGMFRLQFTNVTASSEAYDLIRLA